MSPVRRTISALFATALTVAGTGSCIYLLGFSQGWKGWMVIGSGFVGAIGAHWLYEDLISKA